MNAAQAQGFTIKRFVNDQEVRNLTADQKKLMAQIAIKALGAREKKGGGNHGR